MRLAILSDIQGNRDRYHEGLGPGDPRWLSQQWATLRWQRLNLEQETIALLASLPEQRVVALPGAAPIRLVHGSPRRLSERPRLPAQHRDRAQLLWPPDRAHWPPGRRGRLCPRCHHPRRCLGAGRGHVRLAR